MTDIDDLKKKFRTRERDLNQICCSLNDQINEMERQHKNEVDELTVELSGHEWRAEQAEGKVEELENEIIELQNEIIELEKPNAQIA